MVARFVLHCSPWRQSRVVSTRWEVCAAFTPDAQHTRKLSSSLWAFPRKWLESCTHLKLEIKFCLLLRSSFQSLLGSPREGHSRYTHPVMQRLWRDARCGVKVEGYHASLWGLIFHHRRGRFPWQTLKQILLYKYFLFRPTVKQTTVRYFFLREITQVLNEMSFSLGMILRSS